MASAGVSFAGRGRLFLATRSELSGLAGMHLQERPVQILWAVDALMPKLSPIVMAVEPLAHISRILSTSVALTLAAPWRSPVATSPFLAACAQFPAWLTYSRLESALLLFLPSI